MDSGNSGSMQSSSGGEEEYDSRAHHHHHHSISAFLSNQQVGPLPPPDHLHHSALFEPLSNYFDPSSLSSAPSRQPPLANVPNSLLNLDVVWSKSLRSDTDLGGFITSSSASASPTQQFFTNNQIHSLSNRPSASAATTPQYSSVQVPESGSATSRAPVSNDHPLGHQGQGQSQGRNPKKRSRASRRAPTTVLTTDTTNFRAMVQEFTGIPAPPFTASPFPRTRLDLFGTASTLRSAAAHLDPPTPPYLLRPFAQKFQPPPSAPPSLVSPPPPLSSPGSSTVDATASATTTANGNTTNTSTNSTTSINYQLPQNLLNQLTMQNPILNLHPFVHPTPLKYPLPNSSQARTLEVPSNDTHLKVCGGAGVLEEFGLSNNLQGGLQNMVSPNSNNLDSGGSNDQGGGLLMSINGNYSGNNNNSSSQQRVANGKMVNFSGSSSSDFRGEKGAENVTSNCTRSEGMMESWICSSD